MPFLWLCLFLASALVLASAELSVRVRPDRLDEVPPPPSDAGDHDRDRDLGVYRLLVGGNSSTDTVYIDFEWPDGSVVSQLTDFRAQSQVLRLLLPGEQDLGQPNYQAFCFVSSFPGDLIPPEAVMKLRQKNPWTIRTADEDKGDVVQDSPLVLSPSPIRLAVVSSHLHSFCKDARESIFSSEHELFQILDSSDGPEPSSISKVARKDYDQLARCNESKQKDEPCRCSLRVCFDWYPCSLKYCRNHEGEGEHRCGIKTCRKCTIYRFPIKDKRLCLWDEA